MTNVTLAALLMVTIIVVTLSLGFPIGLSIGLGAAAAIIAILPFSQAMTTASQRFFTGANSFSLVAIPFFILAGNIMNSGGIAKRLIDAARLLTHRLSGDLAHTNIVANMLFGAVSGSGVAAASAMGSILGPMQKEEGYADDFSAAANIASGPTGMMIPPSNIMIVYATVAGSVSIAALFMAGYIPGIIWGLGCMIIAGFTARKLGYKSESSYSFKESLIILWKAIPSLLLIVIVIGGILGAVAGYYGGKLDNTIMRIMDIFLAVPSILLAIAIVSALGPSIINLMLAISISSVPSYARIVRASVLSIRDQEFIEAAKAIGASNTRIIFRHIIPNSLAPVIVQATLGVASAILSTAGLSFIGLGIQPPAPEWGSMLSGGRQYLRYAWWVTTFPGVAIMITILSLNLLGDGLRDALDPRLKQ